MNDWRKVKVKRYSKGMMQRLGLAQALINDPDLIFLDEPTDGVDPVGRKEIRDVLRNLKAAGKTIFLNSHLLSEVELISDQVAILDHGKLLKMGTVDELTVTDSSYHITCEGTVPKRSSPKPLPGSWASTVGIRRTHRPGAGCEGSECRDRSAAQASGARSRRSRSSAARSRNPSSI